MDTKGIKPTERRKDGNSNLYGKILEGKRRDGKPGILTRAEELWEQRRKSRMGTTKGEF